MKKEKRNSILIILAIFVVTALFGWMILDGGKFEAKNIILGLDLRGGASITYQVKGDSVSTQDIEDTISKLQDRVESYSTEASVYQEGEDRIVVDIPGVTDDTDVFESLSEVGVVEFIDEEGNVLLTGDHIKNAYANVSSSEENIASVYEVCLEFNNEGKQLFATATAENLGKTIAINYNGETKSAPTVNAAITDGKAVITGNFTKDEAEKLATYIRIGALPVELEALRSSTVGPQLGQDALTSSIKAGLIGLGIVMVFMMILYRLPGFASSVALILYIVVEVLLLNVLDITLTLPGIAGIILSIGMAVDANVVIFTRIKEEITTGKSVKNAIDAGFTKAMSAIMDGNITTLIAAVILGLRGSGTVKGFAYTLGIGIVVSLFTALFVTKGLVWALYNLGAKKESLYTGKNFTFSFDFIKRKVLFFSISGVLIVIGIVAMGISKADSGEIFAYSLDFMGGTSMTIDFGDEEVPSNSDIEKLYADAADLVVAVAPVKDTNSVIVKMQDLSDNIEKREAIDKAIKDKYGINPDDIEEETISATVSGEMKTDAIVAVTLSIIAMLVYIWFRFKKLSYALGSIIPLIHDVLIVLSVYAITQISVGNTFIACLLTILGYSINSTIVTFDRIRESSDKMKTKEDRKKVVNEAICATFTRSINTAFTTFVMVLVLYIMGVESLKQFTFPLMAGIIAGAYSSICLAGVVWYILENVIKTKPEDPKKTKMDKKIKESKDKILV